MRDVIVIGGGLSGLIACVDLENRRVPYSLIEVKRYLGGSFQTLRQGGFTFDPVTFALLDSFPPRYLEGLGLRSALYALRNDVVAFENGIETFIDALTARISAPRMMRTAVSSIGELESGYIGVCLENGIVLDAKRVIVAAPARFAARMFASSMPDITSALLDYQYDDLQRVTLGYGADQVAERLPSWLDPSHVFDHKTTHATRVPDGKVLLQIAQRISPDHATPADLVAYLTKVFDLPAVPLIQHVAHQPEADPLSCYDANHPARMATIQAALPSRVALIGSDYVLEQSGQPGVVRLDERISNAIAAVNKVMG